MTKKPRPQIARPLPPPLAKPFHLRPTELFMSTVCNIVTQLALCQCGRIHYDATGDFIPTELAHLRAKHAADPDRYYSHDEPVSSGTIDAKQVVYDCPCNTMGHYERFIAENRRLIIRYLTASARTALKDAAATINALRPLQ